MKAGKTFTIDLNIMAKKPTSELVNKLLREFYGKVGEGNCPHEWSNWFASEDGLRRECRFCHKVEHKK